MQWYLLITGICFLQVRCYSHTATNGLASVKEYPAELHKCSATFVTTKHLVTTARCLLCQSQCNYFVQVELRHLMDGGNAFDIEKMKIHPEYERKPQENDIGLIYLKLAVPNANVLLLPEKLDTSKQYSGYTYNWMFTVDKEDFVLQQHNVQTISNALCSLIVQEYVDCQHVCAGSNDSLSFGRYDQGTPLAVQMEGKSYFYGMFSREGLTISVQTEVFQLVTPFVDWIKDNVVRLKLNKIQKTLFKKKIPPSYWPFLLQPRINDGVTEGAFKAIE